MSICCHYSKSGTGDFIFLTSATWAPLNHITSKNERRMLGTEKGREERHTYSTSTCQDPRQSFLSIISSESPSLQGDGCYCCHFTGEKLRLREFKQPAQGHTAGKWWEWNSRLPPQEENLCGSSTEPLPHPQRSSL